jgi:hypothetical protein
MCVLGVRANTRERFFPVDVVEVGGREVVSTGRE